MQNVAVAFTIAAARSQMCKSNLQIMLFGTEISQLGVLHKYSPNIVQDELGLATLI